MLRHFITSINYPKLIKMQSSEPTYFNKKNIKDSKYLQKAVKSQQKVKTKYNRKFEK